MRSAKRWIAISSAVFALVPVTLSAFVVGRSEWLLRRQHSPPTETITAAESAQELKEGERPAVIVGCWEGCHGKRGEGGAEGVGGYFQATAPTLSQVLPEYSDEELAQVIRYGVKRDQRTAIGMIARTFYPLSNRDLALIIGHLRQSPTLQPVPRARQVTVRGRIALALGTWKTSADEVDRSRPRWGRIAAVHAV